MPSVEQEVCLADFQSSSECDKSSCATGFDLLRDAMIPSFDERPDSGNWNCRATTEVETEMVLRGRNRNSLALASACAIVVEAVYPNSYQHVRRYGMIAGVLRRIGPEIYQPIDGSEFHGGIEVDLSDATCQTRSLKALCSELRMSPVDSNVERAIRSQLEQDARIPAVTRFIAETSARGRNAAEDPCGWPAKALGSGIGCDRSEEQDHE